MQITAILAVAFASIAASLPSSPATPTTSLAERDVPGCPTPLEGRTCQQIGRATEHYQFQGDMINTTGIVVDIYLDKKSTPEDIHCTGWKNAPMSAFWLASGYKIDIFS
jgi:hypothetical protein